MLGVHLRRAAKIIILADDVDGNKGDAANGPAQVLAEFREIRIGGLIAHRDRLLPEALAWGEEPRADSGEQLERIDLPGLKRPAIRPVVIAGGQDERMADALERVVDRLVVFLDARHHCKRRIAVIRRRVELKVADVGDQSEVGGVQRREYALIFGFLHLGVRHVADQREIECTLLRSRAARDRHQHQSRSGCSLKTRCHGSVRPRYIPLGKRPRPSYASRSDVYRHFETRQGVPCLLDEPGIQREGTLRLDSGLRSAPRNDDSRRVGKGALAPCPPS